MGDSERINETVETIDMLIVSAIEQLKKSKKRSDEHAILEYLQKKGNSINQQTLSLSIAFLSKNGIIINKPSSGKNSFSVKPSIATEQIAATPTPLENPSTPASSFPNEPHVFSESHDDFRIEKIENLSTEVIALKSVIVEQLYVIKKSVEDFRLENVTANNLELIETLKEEIRYLRNENITKTCIIKSLTENQAIHHVKAITTPKVHQRDTAIHTEVIPKTWPQEEIPTQNTPSANDHKSGNNLPLKLNKENVKKKTLIVGNSIVKHIDGWCLKKRMRSTVSVRSIPRATSEGMIHHVKGFLEYTSPDFIILHHGTNDLNSNSPSEEIADKIFNLAVSVKLVKIKFSFPA